MTEKKQSHAKEAEHESQKQAQQGSKPKHNEGASCGVDSHEHTKPSSSCGC